MGNRPIADHLLGQEGLIAHFAQLIQADQLPHSLLLAGEEGGEALTLALSIAQMLLCEHPLQNGSACGQCIDCRQVETLKHPDLTMVFPVIKSGDAKETTSLLYLDEFSHLLQKTIRLTPMEWRKEQNAGNKQLQIMVAEAERLIHATSLRSFKSQHQVILIWQPELMRIDTANKLLKLIEEPPKGVVFLMVSHKPQKLLPTILSRLQRVTVPHIPEEILIEHLKTKEGLSESLATSIGHLAQGNLYKALQLKETNGEVESLTSALSFLKLPTSRQPKLLLEEAQRIAKLDRPEVLALLNNIPLLLRELLALQSGAEEVVFIPSSLMDDCRKLSQQIPLEKIPNIIDELTIAKQEIMQNANIQMVIFDILLTFTQLYLK